MTEFDRAIRRAPARPDMRRTGPALEPRWILWLILLAAFIASGLILRALT